MQKELDEFAMKRCESALMKNESFLEKERNEDTDTNELREIAEVITYKQGFIDGWKANQLILKCSQEV